MADISNQGVRKNILQEINGRENKERKEESVRRFRVYRKRQEDEIIKKLEAEFKDPSTVQEMRKITSINLTTRMINEVASIYKREPERTFVNASDREKEQLINLYDEGSVNNNLKKANRYFKLQDQCAVHIFPRDNKICVKALQPHQYDVVPDPADPERAQVYITSIFDKQNYEQLRARNTDLDNKLDRTRASNGLNEKIADRDDDIHNKTKYIWWSKEFNFMTDSNGTLIGPDGFPLDEITFDDLKNPIGMLPFIDIAGEKDDDFFVQTNNSFVDFNLDFGVLLSDTANINRLQGYSQAVVVSETKPQNFKVGPTQVLHLPLDPNSTSPAPTFQFATPSPDMNASLALLDLYLNLFQSSEGMDTSTVAGKQGARYTSGVDRLLAMIQKYEATEDDISMFDDVERDAYKILSSWSNVFQDVSANDPKALKEDLRLSKISDSVFVETQFSKPAAVKSDEEMEASVIRRMEAGLMSRAEAIAELRGLELEDAKVQLKLIDNEVVELAPEIKEEPASFTQPEIIEEPEEV